MKTFEFVVHGPFDVPILCDDADGQLDRYEFWRGTGELRQLARQSGCYVFALESTKGNITPAYVGLTRRGFSKEVFNPSNLRKYCRALRDGRRRSPVLFLIVHPSAKGKLNRTYVGELETFLIQAGSAKNPEIRNTKGVARPKWRIRGVTGRRPGKQPIAATKLRSAMGIS